MTAVLLDVAGTVHVSGAAVPGVDSAIRALRDAGHAVRFVSNEDRSRRLLVAELGSLGIAVSLGEVETTALAATRLLKDRRVLALTLPTLREDLEPSLVLVERDPEAVLVGGADESETPGEVFAYERLHRAFVAIRGGARFVCLHRNPWWQTAAGPRLDGGAFVAALEFATGARAEVVGKPSRAFFESALASLGARPDEAVMVGDDVTNDVGGAKAIGMRAVLVRTGKFREESLTASPVKPDAVLDSVSQLPRWLASHS